MQKTPKQIVIDAIHIEAKILAFCYFKEITKYYYRESKLLYFPQTYEEYYSKNFNKFDIFYEGKALQKIGERLFKLQYEKHTHCSYIAGRATEIMREDIEQYLKEKAFRSF